MDSCPEPGKIGGPKTNQNTVWNFQSRDGSREEVGQWADKQRVSGRWGGMLNAQLRGWKRREASE